MSRTLTQLCLPLAVFTILLVRETISYLVYLYPGAGILWSISFAMGHGLLPFQMLLDNLIQGYASKLILIAGLIALTVHGWSANRLAIRFLACHVALVAVCIHAFLTIGMVYGRSASLEGSFGRLLVSLKADDLISLAFILLLGFGCALSHQDYLRRAGKV